jgi:outer membrane protein TolC
MYRLKNIFVLLFGLSAAAYAQQEYRLTLEQAIEMGLQNHQQLKIAAAKIDVSEQHARAMRAQTLPSVTFSANAFYLGDAVVLDSDWSKLRSVEMEHFGNSFALQASQLLYKGGVIKKSIEIAELQKQLAELDRVANEQDIKFLIVSNYLDISKLINQRQVLEHNKALAVQMLENLTQMHEQEMLTRNELIRAELQIKSLEQTILTIKNGHAILSHQLSFALGLPPDVLIFPSEIADFDATAQSQGYYSDMAHREHPLLRSVAKNIEIAEKNVAIQQTNWFPAISAFGGYNMQRPLATNSQPPAPATMPWYNNTWQAGVNVSFNLDNLYKNRHHVNTARSQARVAQESMTLAQQGLEPGVNAAFLKYREAEQQVVLMDESKALANENYEIVLAKYLNQLAIAAEMTDASNAKLNAELQYVNATINALFQYFSLLKATGNL